MAGEVVCAMHSLVHDVRFPFQVNQLGDSTGICIRPRSFAVLGLTSLVTKELYPSRSAFREYQGIRMIISENAVSSKPESLDTRGPEVKATQEKGMFEYSTDLNTNQDEDTSCAWKKISKKKF
ncbi:hypothetical protein Tco_0925020 [Tanacetum coccineum]|uniref:Uncharacterized protein n=1 Tax=Tanacetum coccineum TaxID=301880 RepID=A0ABQ5D5M9_9ASTR